MIGLDTNVVLRYLLQDDPLQSAQANDLIDGQLSSRNPGYINLGTLLEIVWVLRSLFKRSPAEIAAHIQQLLTADSFLVQNEQQVFEAVYALKRGAGEFEDALIGALNAWAGCAYTASFDRKALRLASFRSLGNA